MVNLQIILNLLLKKVPSEYAIKNRCSSVCLDRDFFLKLGTAYLKNYSENELLNMWHFYSDVLRGEGEGVCVFQALFYYTERMLQIEDDEVLCKYTELVNWRSLTLEISEDLLVSAYLAQKVNADEMKRRGFSWKTVIDHNNYYLRKLVRQGIAENHFHLGGSTPIFHFSWLSLMNHVLNAQFRERMERVDRAYRYDRKVYDAVHQEQTLVIQYYQAALMRLLLFAVLTDRQIEIGNYRFRASKIVNHIRIAPLRFSNCVEEQFFIVADLMDYFQDSNRTVYVALREYIIDLFGEEEWEELSVKNPAFFRVIRELFSNVYSQSWIFDNVTDERFSADALVKRLFQLVEEVDVTDIQQVLDMDSLKDIWERHTLENVKELLDNPYMLLNSCSQMESIIDVFRQERGSFHGRVLEDYALLGIEDNYYGLDDYNDVLSGERWLLYSALNKIHEHDARFQKYSNLFYGYLLIKERIRSELIQSNENVGFTNFEKYQNRKYDFIEDSIFGNEIVRYAIRNTVLHPYVESLEIRYAPSATVRENIESIKRYDDIIGAPRDRYFYTVHFIKRPDAMLLKNDGIMRCRHAFLRGKIQQEAYALITMREKAPDHAKRIRGIDAASNEITCRPEVFASIFRCLSNHTVVLDDGLKRISVPQLRMTYHVGEDFLDLADGLRAIDEAVVFLQLRCGDRLGHALALGVNVEEWYASKNNRIMLTQQDYLDNLSWMYNRLFRLNIPEMDNLKTWLEKEYSIYFYRVYGQFLDAHHIDFILREAKQYYAEKGISYQINTGELNFSIFNYHNAWMLRGDEPLLYQKGYFREDDRECFVSPYSVNRHFPGKDEIRYRPEAFILYHYYHYCYDAKKEGEKRIEKKLSSTYIKGVKMLQMVMQHRIAERGIAIETNPSSNYLIGTFRSFEKHPIVNFYNKGLVTSEKKVRECPQFSVSINTDDMGVFSTSLENEYAVLACALEQVVDKKGKPVYNRNMIYEWLDEIRRMGIKQAFKDEIREQ